MRATTKKLSITLDSFKKLRDYLKPPFSWGSSKKYPSRGLEQDEKTNWNLLKDFLEDPQGFSVGPCYEKLSDEELFKRAMADVREIREFRETTIRKKKPDIIERKKKAETEEARELLMSIVTGNASIRLSDTGEYMEWVNTGARKDLCERLHRGDFSIQDYIDLHGMTLIEAEGEIARFLRNSISKGLSCVKIIHGRGLSSPKGPVLKTALVKWLQGKFKKYIIAYATARDKDGGLGATYVILNRNP